jgi:hypothetical protein
MQVYTSQLILAQLRLINFVNSFVVSVNSFVRPTLSVIIDHTSLRDMGLHPLSTKQEWKIDSLPQCVSEYIQIVQNTKEQDGRKYPTYGLSV